MHNREFKFGYQHFLLCQKSFLKVSSKWFLKNKSDNGKLLLGKTYSGERFRAILALLFDLDSLSSIKHPTAKPWHPHVELLFKKGFSRNHKWPSKIFKLLSTRLVEKKMFMSNPETLGWLLITLGGFFCHFNYANQVFSVIKFASGIYFQFG